MIPIYGADDIRPYFVQHLDLMPGPPIAIRGSRMEILNRYRLQPRRNRDLRFFLGASKS